MNIYLEELFHIKENMFLYKTAVKMETLFIVDDDKAIVDLCRIFLEELGYHILTADAPDTAIRIAREYKGKIHLLITDIMMPVMNGLELAEELCIMRPDIKYIFMSGHLPETIFSSEVFKRSKDFITKPFKFRDFIERIRQVLDS